MLITYLIDCFVRASAIETEFLGSIWSQDEPEIDN